MALALLAAVAWSIPAAAGCETGEPEPVGPRSPFAPGETVPAIAATPVPTITVPGATVDPLVATRHALDATISAASHEDIEALAAAAKFAMTGCDNDAYPRPACPPSMPAGTDVPVFPYVACTAAYADAPELEGILTQVLRGRGPELFALLRSDDAAAEGPFPLGPYVAVFRTNPPFGVSGSSGALLAMDEAGRVLSLRTGCRATPEQLLESIPVLEVLVPPQK